MRFYGTNNNHSNVDHDMYCWFFMEVFHFMFLFFNVCHGFGMSVIMWRILPIIVLVNIF